jgi:hypothetical protein
MLWKCPSWPPCNVFLHIISFWLFYTQHMFSYSKCNSGFYAICAVLVAHALQGDFNTIISFPMFIDPQATSRMFPLCYANTHVIYCILHLCVQASCNIMQSLICIPWLGWKIYWAHDLSVVQWSFGLSLGNFICFFKGAWPPLNGLTCCPYLLEMLGFDHSYTCDSHHQFPICFVFVFYFVNYINI